MGRLQTPNRYLRNYFILDRYLLFHIDLQPLLKHQNQKFFCLFLIAFLSDEMKQLNDKHRGLSNLEFHKVKRKEVCAKVVLLCMLSVCRI